MNHIHRIIFNRSLGVYQVVCETARSGRGGLTATTSVAGAATLALALACAPAWAAGGAGGAGDYNHGGNGGAPGEAGANTLIPGTAQVENLGGSAGTSPGGHGGDGASKIRTSGAGGGGGRNGSFSAPANGNGGNGGVTTAGGDKSIGGGGGGAGGHGPAASSGNWVSFVAFTGGRGGHGSDGQAGSLGGAGAGGGGGDGGTALMFSGNSFTNSISASIAGGAGGNGGKGNGTALLAGAVGHGGAGGAGGAGVDLGHGTELVNKGSISGGDGGVGGASDKASAGSMGAGGVGLLGANLDITHSGSISGGVAGGNGARADAIRFTGGNNRLELQQGYSILGTVNAAQGSNTLVLGGFNDASFSVSNIGASMQFQGFGSFQKTGASTWTLTDNTSAVTPWTISGGTLSISSDANLGAASGAITLDSGTLHTRSSVASGRAITLGVGGGTFVQTSGFSLVLSGAISGTGDLAKNGDGVLFLLGDNSGHTGRTVVTQGNLRVGNAGTTGTLGPGAVTVAPGAVLSFSRSNDLTVNNAIGGSGWLEKHGASTLTLSGTSSHTGNTWVAGGTLDVSGSLNSATVRVASNATLTSSGTSGVLAGAVTLEDGGHLALVSRHEVVVG